MTIENLPEMQINPFTDMVNIEFRVERKAGVILKGKIAVGTPDESAISQVQEYERVCYNVIGEGIHIAITQEFIDGYSLAKITDGVLAIGDIEILLLGHNPRYRLYYGQLLSQRRSGEFIIPIPAKD